MADAKTELQFVLHIMENRPEEYIQSVYETDCGTRRCAAGWIIHREYQRQFPQEYVRGLYEQARTLGDSFVDYVGGWRRTSSASRAAGVSASSWRTRPKRLPMRFVRLFPSCNTI